MSKITQYSRISHHTIYGLTGSTFSVPSSEDFTDGSWTIKDLALSEIGVNEGDKKVYIRIDDEIKEFQLAGGTSSAEPLSTTLVAGNTTGANWIKSEPLFGILSEDGITSPGYTYSYTIRFDPMGFDGGTTFTSASLPAGEISTITQTPFVINLDCYDGVTLKSGANWVDTFGVINSIYTSSTDILLSSTDILSTITDTIILDPSSSLGVPRTGIKSQNATTGIYSQTTHTPTDIILASVDGAGETSQLVISNGGGAGVEIQTGDANNYSTINITSLYTNLSLNDVTNNKVDTLVLDTGYTGITSADTLSGNVSKSTYTPNGISTQTTTTSGDDTAIILATQSINIRTINGTDEGQTWYTKDTIISQVYNDTPGITDTITIDPKQLSGGLYPGGTNILSENMNTYNYSRIGLTPDTIISTSTDMVSSITDTISLDPQGLGNGTGIKSENSTTGEKLYSTYNTGYYETVLDSISINDRRDFITLDTQGYGNETGIKSENLSTSNLSGINFTPDNSSMYASDNVNTVYDSFALDPQGLGNGTGIKSENSTTGEYSSVSYAPNGIYQQVSDGVLSTSYISQDITKIGMVVSDGTLDGTNIIGIGINSIYLNTSGVARIFDGDKLTTTNNTTQDVYLSPVTTNKATSIKVIVKGIDNTFSSVYGAELFGVFKNTGGTVSQVSTTDKNEKTLFSTATSDLDTDGTNIRVRVTGETGKTIDWQVSVEYI